MAKFLLFSFPISETTARYFPAAYVAGIIKKTGWEFQYVDLNSLIFQACKTDGLELPKWDASNQLELFNLTKETSQKVLHDIYVNTITPWSPDLLGFSLMDSNRHFAIFALRELKKLGSTIPVIFGGPDCFPREYHLNYIAERYPPDIILQGEAEIALPKFLAEYQTDKKVQTQIPGFVYKGCDGSIIDTGPPELSYLKEASIQADYSIFSYSTIPCAGDNTITIFTSKGCINKCAFCSESRNYQPYRRRKAVEVVAEIEQNLARLPNATNGNIEVVFRDSIFNASAAYLKEICELILEKKLKFSWFCLGAFKTIMPTELLNLMYRSGCRTIFFGFESASQRVIDLMGKNFDINHAQNTIENCLSHEINVVLPIINGFPGEFTRDFLTSLAFIARYRNRPHITFGYSNICSIKNKTPLSEYPQDFLIGNPDETEYWVQDNLNTPASRQLRQVITDATIRKISISSSHKLKELNFNDVSVAVELAHLIHFVCFYLQDEDTGKNILASFDNREITLQPTIPYYDKMPHCRHAIPGIDLEQWLHADKNEQSTKNRIISFLDEIINNFSIKVLAQNSFNFQTFRNSLYTRTKQNRITESPAGYHLHLIRLSQYDGGNQIIFSGSLSENVKGPFISRIEASCGQYYFDIHHGTQNYFASTQKNKSAVINFWGKFHKKRIIDNILLLTVIFDNTKRLTFKFEIDILLDNLAYQNKYSNIKNPFWKKWLTTLTHPS